LALNLLHLTKPYAGEQTVTETASFIGVAPQPALLDVGIDGTSRAAIFII